MAEDRCDFLFSTGEFTERDVRDDWSGLFDLVENHVDEDGGEEESKFRETNASESITAGTAVSGVSGSSRRRDSSSSSVGSGRETVRAEDLLHNDKETEDDREGEVEEPLGGGGGTAMQALGGGGGRAVPKNWESEEKRISTHSRHHRRRRQKKHRYTQ